MRVPAVAWAGGAVAVHLLHTADAFVVSPTGMSLASRVDTLKEGANDVFFILHVSNRTHTAAAGSLRCCWATLLRLHCLGCSEHVPTVL